ncbi:MAG: nucleotide exchange factor GrpE [Lachnospiraceae bacterium]|nr:nucleotide exchange factor GrpE [Lachnospiraceae bacterium]
MEDNKDLKQDISENEQAAQDAAEQEAAEAAGAEEMTEEEVIVEDAEASEEVSEEADAEGDGKEKKKGFFSRKKDKRDEQIEELTDRVKRQMAEFDNFRKRTEKEKSAMFEVGARSVLEKILPVVDNFERGLDTAKDRQDDAFVVGMEKTYKQLMTLLESLEVKPIEAAGQTFDPNLHNAVMHVEDESVGENTIVEEFQKGYTYRDSVLRYSMVKVAN